MVYGGEVPTPRRAWALECSECGAERAWAFKVPIFISGGGFGR
jgi:hypothetical protein